MTFSTVWFTADDAVGIAKKKARVPTYSRFPLGGAGAKEFQH